MVYNFHGQSHHVHHEEDLTLEHGARLSLEMAGMLVVVAVPVP
jgi:hypothetical protein